MALYTAEDESLPTKIQLLLKDAAASYDVGFMLSSDKMPLVHCAKKNLDHIKI